jgi:hypothetical protein
MNSSMPIADMVLCLSARRICASGSRRFVHKAFAVGRWNAFPHVGAADKISGFPVALVRHRHRLPLAQNLQV